MLFAGRVIDRIGTKRAFVLAIVVWSLGAIAHAYAIGHRGTRSTRCSRRFGLAAVPVSIAGFMLGRAVLAVGEAGNFPAAIKATAEYFPKTRARVRHRHLQFGRQRRRDPGAADGALIAAHWGWQAAFIAIGAIGFIWMGLWIWLYDTPERQRRLGAAELAYINSDDAPLRRAASRRAGAEGSWFELLGYRQTWAFAFGKFMTDGVWWFFLFWLPKYLSAQYGMSGPDMVVPLAVLYSMTMVGSIGGGWFPTWFINRGHDIYHGRMKRHARHRPVPAGRAAGPAARLHQLTGCR